MIEPTITCPNCKTEIKLTESLAAPLVQEIKARYEHELAEKEIEFARCKNALSEQRAELAKASESIEQQITARLTAEHERIAAEETKKARLLVAADLERKSQEVADLQQVLKERDIKLTEAQAAQAALIRKQRELDDAKRELELTIETRVQESLAIVRDKAKREAEDALKSAVLEKEGLITSMQQQIEDLGRKATQGSQQLQGEVQELELERMLRDRFPRDMIQPVPKGEFGGDVLHGVLGDHGQHCGTILWEIKQTKNWSDGWLAKLRDDQRSAKADMAVLVSQALPKGMDAFDLVDGVWVTETRFAIPVGMSLRQALIEICAARSAGEGQQTKMELVYQYLTGPRFRQRLSAIVEKFSDMQTDLNKERKAMTRLWARREEQIRGVMESTVGMYGDLQGIAGKTLQEIEGLDTRLLESTSDTDVPNQTEQMAS